MSHRPWIITGASGQVGTALMRLAGEAGIPVAAVGHAELGLDDAEGVATHPAFRDAPVVINLAAHTAVDRAESEPGAAYAVNRDGPANLALRCRREGAHLIHVSTDYVFGPGVPRRPLRPDDPTGPDTVYGASKLAGERAILDLAADGLSATIVRTAWVYTGPRWPGGDFATAMLRLLADPDREIRVVDDQHGNPTYAPHLAAGLLQLASDPVPGILHATGGGATTWCGLARAIAEEAGHDPARIGACATADFPRPAPRPEWSVLDGSSWASVGLDPLPEWRAGVRAALA